MTLYLELLSSTGQAKNSILYVQGSEAGSLISNKTSSQPFKIKCNKNNLLTLSVYDQKSKSVEDKLKIGWADFSPARFLRQNRTNPALYTGTQPIKYETSVFNQKQLPVGTLVFAVRYEKGLFYMGEQQGLFETLPQKEPVKVFAGVCQNRNLFNYFDSASNSSQPLHVVETTYRDQTWE